METDEQSEASELDTLVNKELPAKTKQKREVIINTTHKMHKEIIPSMYQKREVIPNTWDTMH